MGKPPTGPPFEKHLASSILLSMRLDRPRQTGMDGRGHVFLPDGVAGRAAHLHPDGFTATGVRDCGSTTLGMR
jgi:hypothetical protein